MHTFQPKRSACNSAKDIDNHPFPARALTITETTEDNIKYEKAGIIDVWALSSCETKSVICGTHSLVGVALLLGHLVQ